MKRLTHEEFQQIRDRLVELLGKLDIDRCYLFGSYARGDYHYGSDLDLCVVEKTTEDWFERTRRLRRALEELPIEVEPHVYTPEEFQRLADEGNPLVGNVLAEGELLCAR